MHCTVRDILLQSARAGLGLQRPDGSFLPGTNGPRTQKDTPVRVTAHWGSLFLAAEKLAPDQAFRDAADKCRDYLVDLATRDGFQAFSCIESENLGHRPNGLIGQAWAMEFLISHGQARRDEDCPRIAEQLALRHPFDSRLRLWRVIGLDGRALDIHPVLNQQIWFCLQAYRVASLRENGELMNRVIPFLYQLPDLLSFKGGVIDMYIPARHLPKAGLIERALQALKARRKRVSRENYRVGYLSFTLLGLALLHRLSPRLHLWKQPRLHTAVRQSIKFLDTAVLQRQPGDNRFLYSYNPTGFEVAVTKASFGDLFECNRANGADWINKQLEACYDQTIGLMNKNTSDAATLQARVYELAYYPDLRVRLRPEFHTRTA